MGGQKTKTYLFPAPENTAVFWDLRKMDDRYVQLKWKTKNIKIHATHTHTHALCKQPIKKHFPEHILHFSCCFSLGIYPAKAYVGYMQVKPYLNQGTWNHCHPQFFHPAHWLFSYEESTVQAHFFSCRVISQIIT